MNENTKVKNFTRGGQITFHNLRMLFQINKTVSTIFFISLAVLTVLIICMITPREITSAAYYWCYSNFFDVLSVLGIKGSSFNIPYHGVMYHETPESFLNNIRYIKNADKIFNYLMKSVIVSSILSFGITIFFVKWLTNQGEKQTSNKFIRGSKFAEPNVVAKIVRNDEVASDIHIDKFPLIRHSETQHLLIHGTTGSGKSQLIMKLLDSLRARGDSVLLYDKGGAYTSIYYRENVDKILNPFDSRTENWDLWSEALEAPDFENMAESLIPMHGETDPFWVNAARTIFGSAAFTMQDKEDRSIDKLLKLLLTSELKELEKYIANTEAATLVSDKIEKTAVSIRSVISTYLKSLRFLRGLDQQGKAKFSIREWMREKNQGENNPQNNSWLFISSASEQHASLRPLISMWFAMASITLLSLSENRNRRIWLICDELPSLHKLPQLPETIAEARKFGGCFVLGMQSFAQLEKVYGRNAAREIFDLLNTRFFFRSPSADLAKFVSQELGEEDVEDMRENYSYGANTIRDGISIGTQRITRPIIVYPEIMNLPDMKCYLRLPNEYPVTLLNLILQKRKKIESEFIFRKVEVDPEIEEGIEMAEKRILINGVIGTVKKVETTNAETKTSDDAADAKKTAQGAYIAATEVVEEGKNDETLAIDIQGMAQEEMF